MAAAYLLKRKDPMKRLLLIAVLAALVLAGCKNHGAQQTAKNEFYNEQKYVNQQLLTLRNAERFPKLLDSADLRIQAENYTSEADPNKVWYVTLVGLDGTPFETFTTRGPVESASDQVTNDRQVVCIGGADCNEVSLAEPNGVYQGQSADHIAVLTSGAIVRFEGNYIQSDQPFKLTTPVKLSIDETQPITRTDTTKTQGGVVPTRR